MNHPPTTCDRNQFLDKNDRPIKIEPDSINKAVPWYEQNWVTVSESLPITINGITYLQRWQDVMDRQTLPAYRAGDLSPGKSVAYIYWPLKRLAKGLKANR